MELLQSRNLVSSQYVKSLEKLITLPKVSLIRLGKNGADSKTYQGENIAQIKIMGAKGTPPMFKDSSTTVWLAGTSSVQQTDLLPFGWALIEVDPTGENETLKTWCEAQPKSKFEIFKGYPPALAEILYKSTFLENHIVSPQFVLKLQSMFS